MPVGSDEVVYLKSRPMNRRNNVAIAIHIWECRGYQFETSHVQAESHGIVVLYAGKSEWGTTPHWAEISPVEQARIRSLVQTTARVLHLAD